MEPAGQPDRIHDLVEGYLRQHGPLEAYLDTVDGALREPVRQLCEQADAASRQLQELAPLRLLPPLPTKIAGCELGEQLGAGAMGLVFRARQHELERDIALKLVRAELADQAEFLQRFDHEAKALASLDHPGIVKVLFCGAADGWLYFGMELVAGGTLADAMPQLLRRENDATDARRFDPAARLLAEALEALAYVHRQQIVHRDLKPSNVMLDANGHAKLVDFGLAKSQQGSLRTVPGQLLGTPAYMSPELVGNRWYPRHTPDVWAVGVILFELLTGRLPYAGATTADVLRQLLRPTLQDPRRYCSDVPKSLAAICRRALAPALDDRYSSASEFAADLRRFLAGEPVLAERRSVWRAVRRRLWRQRHLLAGLVAVAAVGAMVHLKTAADGEQAERTKLLTELPAADTLGHAPWARVLAADATCRRLQALGGFSSAQQEQLAAVQSAIAAAAAARHERGRADIERGAGSRRGAPLTSYRAPVPAVQAAGVAAVSEAVLIRDDLTPSTALLATTQPVLQIAAPANMVDAPVRVDAIDPLRGDVLLTVATGVAPCSLPVPLGQYRIVVGDAAAFAECSRTLVAPGDHPVVPVLHATATVQSQMVTIAAGTAIVGQDVPGATIYQQCTVTHGAFCIDATEVTCGAYHAYCVATAAALPATWHGTYDPAWASLPVVGVSFHDARRFAEWRGKRLPTWIEWQIAARGPIGTLYPWGNDAGQLGDVVALGGDPTAPWHVGVRAVGSDSLDTSWCGALDLLANAPEWTDTTYVGQLDGVPIPFLAWHLTGGAGWTTPRDPVFVQLDGVSPNPPEAKEVGFRCAKSIAH